MSSGMNNVPLYAAYAVGGMIMAAGNLVVSLCIGCHSALRSRNSYAILLGQSLAEFFFTLSYGLGGIYRLVLVWTASHGELIPVQQCMLTPQNLLWTFTPNWSAWMLVLVSADRLLSILFPLQYIGFPRSYVYSAVAFATLPNLLAGGSIVYSNFGRNLSVPAPCFASHVYGSIHFVPWFYYFRFPAILACASIVIYVFVWLGYKRSQARVATEQHRDEYQLQQERRLTYSLGFACICTLLFFLLPFLIGDVLAKAGYRSLSLVFYVLASLNPGCNVVVYMLRHEELRQALRALVKRQTMPQELRMWKQNSLAKGRRANEAHNNNNDQDVIVSI